MRPLIKITLMSVARVFAAFALLIEKFVTFHRERHFVCFSAFVVGVAPAMLLPKDDIFTHHPVANGDDQDEVIEVMRVKCLQTMLDEERRKAAAEGLKSLEPRCPRVWDGILCWGDAAAGETAYLPCPDYIAGFETTAVASRQCLQSGDWFFRPEAGNDTWTNYTMCTPSPYATLVISFPQLEGNASLGVEWIPVVKTISRTGYIVSLFTLVLAFLIMASIKKLRCPRNILHMHLFASFIMRAFMSVLKDSLFVNGIGLSNDVLVQNGETFVLSEGGHSWECKMVISLWQFFIMANYSWVLMEGLYLHNLIFLALFSDTSSIAMYVILGWGIPVLIVVPWIILRAVLEDTLCWTTNENPLFFLVIRIPIIISILINFAMFLNIVRVVFLKLQSSVSEETRRCRFRRWAKSTIVLVPLFGVHYTVFLGMSYSIGVNQVVEIIWLFCDLFFASFQGSVVAVLYCFMNGEVRAELIKTWICFCKSVKNKGRRARWLASADDSEGSNAPNGGGILFLFPQSGCKAQSATNKVKKVGFEGTESGAESDDKHKSTAKSGNRDTKLHSINMMHFPRFGRQMSAPAGYMASDAKLSLRGSWAPQDKRGKSVGAVAKALGQSDLIEGTKRVTKKWTRFGRVLKTDAGSPFTSASYCTTHFSVDDGGEHTNSNSEFACDEDAAWSQVENEGSLAPLLQQEYVESRGSSLQRSYSAGASLRIDHFDEICEVPKGSIEEGVFVGDEQHPKS